MPKADKMFVAMILDWSKTTRDERWEVREDLNYTTIQRLLGQGCYSAVPVRAASVTEVFETLNLRKPEGAKFNSMSVGDLVLDTSNSRWYFCGPYDWKDCTALVTME